MLPGRCDAVLSRPLAVSKSAMAAMGPEDRAGAGSGGTGACPSGPCARVSTIKYNSNGPEVHPTQVSRLRETGLTEMII